MAETYPFETGPYLSAALICEKVLIEADGVKSAIRIVDRVTRQAFGPNPPEEMAPWDYDIYMFLRFKSGRARGPMTLEIQPEKPSGEYVPSQKMTIIFEGEDDRGIDSIGQVRLKVDQVGIYWFNVILKGVRITRIPLRIIYVPQITRAIPGTSNPPPA